MYEGSIALHPEMPADARFDGVFATYHTYVYRLALALLGQVEDAEDVTQEVFLRVYKALPSYQPERASLRTWLTQVAVHACQTHRRRHFWQRRRQTSLPDGAAPDDLPDLIDPSPWVAPEDQALLAELRQSLWALLAQLRPEHRSVLVLHYYLDLSCAEIAALQHCSEGTICSRLYYARRRLQAHLDQQARHREGFQ
ncbi:MAG TPA: RNA polymerase sigma factor [Chloroflexia bacterium]|nr:RNA polymerase sigma factor [Chloroflexia bacterium]